jgi:choice-of-anchor A domain-containing protein
MSRTSTSLLMGIMTWTLAASLVQARPTTLVPTWPARLAIPANVDAFHGQGGAPSDDHWVTFAPSGGHIVGNPGITGPAACGAIAGLAWEDQDEDGEPGAAEAALDDVVVTLFADLDGDGVSEAEVASQATEGGEYRFEGLDEGRYRVEVAPASLPEIDAAEAWILTGGEAAAHVMIKGCEAREDVDFGFFHAFGCMQFMKTGPSEAEPGETIVYTFKLKNCGSIWLQSGAHIYDAMLNPGGNHQIWYEHVAPGETYIVEREYTLPAGASGTWCNEAQAIGYPIWGVEGAPGAVVLPQIEITDTHCLEICEGECAEAFCGDGVVQPELGEVCDDGNLLDGDGCNADCQPGVCGDGVVDPGEACDDGDLVAGDGCDEDCATEVCVDDPGAAGAFNVLVFEEYVGGLDVCGAAAAGELVDMSSFSVGWGQPGGAAVVSGGALFLESGTVHGDAWAAGAASVSEDVDFQGGALQQGAWLDFLAVEAQVKGLSARLASLPANGQTLIEGQPWVTLVKLVGTDNELNVFELSGAALSVTAQLTIDVPVGATVVVNVDGQVVSMANFGFVLWRASPTRVLWNLHQATSLDVNAISVQGSALAPYAEVSFYNGNWDGGLVARSVYGGGEFHCVPFEGFIPCE